MHLQGQKNENQKSLIKKKKKKKQPKKKKKKKSINVQKNHYNRHKNDKHKNICKTRIRAW